MFDLFTFQNTTVNPAYITTIFTVLLSFLLSTLVAVSYVVTFRGLSYSRNYVQALILSSIVSSMIMLAIGDSLARGLGMLGALAIIRFRTNFKDSRDIIFMFASLAAGISCGVYAYAVGIIGIVAFCIAVFILHFTTINASSIFDGLLRFSIAVNSTDDKRVESVLNANCRLFALITLREIEQGEKWEYAYHVKLRNPKNRSTLLQELQKIESIKGLSLMFQESTIEL